MPMMVAVRVVVADHSPVVALVQLVVDIGKVVASDTAVRIDPDLAPQFAIASSFRNDVALVADFPFSHDEK